MQDHGGDCAVVVHDRDRIMEDVDSDFVPGLFSFGEDPVCWSQRDDSGPMFSPTLFYGGTRVKRFEKAFNGIGVVLILPKK